MNLYKHKSTVIVSFTFILLCLLTVLVYFAFHAEFRALTTQHLEKQQKQLAVIGAHEVEQYFHDIQKRMETIALSSEVRDASRSEACNQSLQEIVKVNSRQLNNLGRVNKEGTFICAVNRTIIGESVTKYGDYFEKIKNDPEHKPAMSRLILPTGSSSPVMAFHVPVFDANGRFDGTIGGAVYFEELQEQLLAGTQLSDHSLLAIYDDNLDALSNPDPLIQGKNLDNPEIKQLYGPGDSLEYLVQKVKQAPNEGVMEYSFRNEPRRAVYKSAHVAGRYWTVLVIIPIKDFDSYSKQPVIQNLLIGTILLLILTVSTSAFILARKVRKIGSKRT